MESSPSPSTIPKSAGAMWPGTNTHLWHIKTEPGKKWSSIPGVSCVLSARQGSHWIGKETAQMQPQGASPCGQVCKQALVKSRAGLHRESPELQEVAQHRSSGGTAAHAHQDEALAASVHFPQEKLPSVQWHPTDVGCLYLILQMSLHKMHLFTRRGGMANAQGAKGNNPEGALLAKGHEHSLRLTAIYLWWVEATFHPFPSIQARKAVFHTACFAPQQCNRTIPEHGTASRDAWQQWLWAHYHSSQHPSLLPPCWL